MNLRGGRRVSGVKRCFWRPADFFTQLQRSQNASRRSKPLRRGLVSTLQPHSHIECHLAAVCSALLYHIDATESLGLLGHLSPFALAPKRDMHALNSSIRQAVGVCNTAGDSRYLADPC